MTVETEREINLIRRKILQNQREAAWMQLWSFEPLELPDTSEMLEVDADRNSWPLAELLCYHDRLFVHNAYVAVLKRDPDKDGMGSALSLLRGGHMSRVEWLLGLCNGPEGSSHQVQVVGLSNAFTKQKIYRIPVIGRLLRFARVLAHLPQMQRDVEDIKRQIAINKSDHNERLQALLEFQNAQFHRLEKSTFNKKTP
ncbi:MAG: DUF4214 domain-containing protein [Halieaceae bacterium]|jgi:hypothetical protein|nr:DUF4214 domain-containing protein [Halieaceae bacterium]